MPLTIAHVVNPVVVSEDSDLFLTQPITFESMRRARAAAAPDTPVALFTAQYAEDLPMVPRDFSATPNLDRSVLDFGQFEFPRKLPLLRDVLDKLYHASTAEYLIYTNVDIGLQPHFYTSVRDLIGRGYDALVINRRTVPDRYSSTADLEAIYAEPGAAHRGWDCFVFPRAVYPRFRLGTICVGASRFDLALLANMVAYGRRFHLFQNEHLTFHLGDERRWRVRRFDAYGTHNTDELMRILDELQEDRGAFDRASIPGSFLLRKNTFGPLYDAWSRYVTLPVSISQLLNRLVRR